MNTPNKFDVFREKVNKLHALLQEPEEGCFTWHMFLNETMVQIITLWAGESLEGLASVVAEKVKALPFDDTIKVVDALIEKLDEKVLEDRCRVCGEKMERRGDGTKFCYCDPKYDD